MERTGTKVSVLFFCPALETCFQGRKRQPTEWSSHGGGKISQRFFRHACKGLVRFGGLASVANRSKHPLSNRGDYYKKQGTKQLQKSRYETMYEVIRTYCTCDIAFSTRQVENSISEAQTTWCMLLWADAFFDWRNEHEWHGFYRSIENKTERLRLFPKQTGKGTAYQQTEPEWDWEWENQSQQGNEAYAPALSGLLQMHTAFYCTQLAEKNMNPKNLQYIMGHASITLTLDLYAHASEAGANRELRSLVAWFTTICTTFSSECIRDYVQFCGRPARRKKPSNPYKQGYIDGSW